MTVLFDEFVTTLSLTEAQRICDMEAADGGGGDIVDDDDGACVAAVASTATARAVSL